MSKTTRANLRTWGAVACVLIGALTLAGCPARERADIDAGDSAGPDAFGPGQSAGMGGASGPGQNPGAGGASGPGAGGTAGATVGPSSGGPTGGASQAADGGLPADDAGTKAPPANQACTVAAQCPSGFCVDGVCCDAACDGACQSCSQTGRVGTCSPVKNATDDVCAGGSTCDATGACRKVLGQSCSAATQCASGNCVDGVCCATAGCGTCQACMVAGLEGKCAPVPRFVDDETCNEMSTCDGLGECRRKNGSMCAAGKDCVSLNCVDGVCCNAACDGICFSCDQAQSLGTCLPLGNAEDSSASTPCGGKNICAVQAGGQPACKLKNGQTCATNAECASGTCKTIIVPPDPNDPYDLGYSYTRCE